MVLPEKQRRPLVAYAPPFALPAESGAAPPGVDLSRSGKRDFSDLGRLDHGDLQVFDARLRQRMFWRGDQSQYEAAFSGPGGIS
jgi:hypothetical protein